MKIDLTPEDIERIVTALNHYEAYLRSQQRSEREYSNLADRLRPN